MDIPVGFIMFPLQSNANRFKNMSQLGGTSTSTTSPVTVAIVIGIIVAVIFIIYFINKKSTQANKKGGTSGGGARRFSFFTLHRIAKDCGLNREQTRMFEYVLRTGGVSDPEAVLNSPNQLDQHFRRTYKIIERSVSSQDELNTRLSTLFSTRNVIEANIGNVGTETSTRQIPDNSQAVLGVGENNYHVKVLSSKGDALVVQNPTSNTGRVLNLSRGTKVKLAVFTKSNRGFSVESRILDSADTQSGPVVQLAHSGEIKRLSNRRFRRRQMVIPVSFYLVHIEGVRKNQKMVVDKRRFSGNIMDISIGGCSIKTNMQLNSAGQRLKIEFTFRDGSAIATLGQVLRTNRTGVNTILHIKFLKVPRRSLNSINAMVYEYIDD
jgi:c-di-GMP-binding flagellar brake protein YcgR